MDTRYIRHILSIVENDGNLTKASKKMFMTQPALSQILKKIENEHGVLLFDRNKNPMTLTKSGQSYVRTARIIVDMIDSLQKEFDEENGLERGELHIGVTPFRATYFLPKVLVSYYRKYPGVNVILHQSSNRELLRLMEESSTDLTIGDFNDRFRIAKFAECVDLRREEMLLVMHPSHPCAGIGVIDDMTPLENELLMISPTGEPMRDILDGFFRMKNFVPKRVMETNNAEFCLNMITEGVGISIVSEAMCGVENSKITPVYAHFAGSPPTMVVSVAYMRKRYLSLSARAFLREIDNLVGDIL
jgi:DNA-binding transcriptional LysR family regulator